LVRTKPLGVTNSFLGLITGCYYKYGKPLKISGLVIGSTIMMYLLRAGFLNPALLVLYLFIMLLVLPLIMKNPMAFGDSLGSLVEISFIILNTLTESVLTPEFQTNYPNISHTSIFFLHLGIAMILLNIYSSDNNSSSFDRLKITVKEL
jgi:hypothetical protein